MIEGCSRPGRCRVTLLAGSRESCGNVIWVSCFVEIGLVTTDACCRSAFVLSVYVTLRTDQRLVRTGEREAGRPMIKLSTRPCRGAVAL